MKPSWAWPVEGARTKPRKKLGAIHEQRRRASERAAEKAAVIQESLDAEMRKNWEIVLGTRVDSKEEVEATVTRLLQDSQKNKQIKTKRTRQSYT